MSIKALFAALLLFPLISCSQINYEQTPEISFSITSPKDGWTYYDDTKILLAVNVNTRAVIWASDINGGLGEGSHLSVFMPAGVHRITAVIQGVPQEKQITVFARNSGQNRTILINNSPLEFKTKSGTSYPFLFTQEGSITGCTASTGKSAGNRAVLMRDTAAGDMPGICRDIRLAMPDIDRAILAKQQTTPRTRNRAAETQDMVLPGAKKTFYVVNTRNQMGTPHEIEAVLRYSSNNLAVWVPETCGLQDEILNELIQKSETLIIPRVQTLWGKPADIDGDGRFALLLSPTINEEKIAVGFFNPADFFTRNTDVQSPAYNPASNEMDILYTALPEDGPDSSYSVDTIAATIAHELTHAATFTVKTWERLENGGGGAAREELFLDEGWSHLTENLCGYGISGGNVKFVNRFFEDTSMYSFCGANRIGQEDSAGLRGAVTLFLSWLFWEAGGMGWDAVNPVALRDLGGISFLRRMTASAQTGWESIGLAFGKRTETLFIEMLEEINRYRTGNIQYQYKTDPLTGEAVDFFVNMGLVGFPKTAGISGVNTLGSWSFVILDPLLVSSETVHTIQSQYYSGNVYLDLASQ